MKATILYPDLADSTGMAMGLDRRIAARVAKAFLAVCSRIIKHEGGTVTSFDGDRVMGVFMDNRKNTHAATAALKINHAFLKVLRPKFEAKYSVLRSDFTLAHCTGVDTSDVLIVRGGLRNTNDLIWIGRGPNVAAKLSDFRNSPYHSYISSTVYSTMTDQAKLSNDGRPMWEKRSWKNGPISTMYRSSWTWTI